ncbi:CatB-related O-acetyltransferase [Pseudomonas oleovorans]|nr:CatB-related O-acetyltransferase [Pseudomonas oleovorans]
MYKIEGGLLEVEWSSRVEDFFEMKSIFLGYPWRVRGVIPHGRKIKISSSVVVEPYANMAAGIFYSAGAFSYCRSNKVTSDFSVGRYCSVAPGVELSDQDHPLDRVSTHSFTFKKHSSVLALEVFEKNFEIQGFKTLKAAPIIGNDVWLGKDCLIKRGVVIGHGAVVAQRAVVTKDVPSFAIVAGVPARIIKYRFPDELIQQLLKLSWWDYGFYDFGGMNICDVSKFIFHRKVKTTGFQPVSFSATMRGWRASAWITDTAVIRSTRSSITLFG